MQYRYFVHCRHAISVFTNTNFSYDITVLGTPNVPLHMYIEYRLNTWGWPEEELSLLSVLAAVGSCPFSTHSSSDSYSNDDNDNLNQTNKQKNEQQQIGRFSDLSDIGQLRWLDVLAKFFHLAPQQQTNKQTHTIRTRPLSNHPSDLSKIG